MAADKEALEPGGFSNLVSNIKTWVTSKFASIERAVPAGGSAGQTLVKSSATNYDMAWSSPKMSAGIICPFGGSSAPTGFLMCNGQAVSRTTYAALFAVIGTTYGGGNGSTTFNVPDLRGRTVIGSNSSHALGSTGGAETVKLTKNESALPAHAHGFTQPTVNGGATTTGEKSLTGWTALYSDTGMFNPGNSYRSGIIYQGGVRSTSYRPAWTGGTSYDMSINATHTHSQVAHTHSVTGGAVSQNNGWDASQAHNNMQPFATINYIISTGG